MAAPDYIPTSSVGGFPFSTPFPSFNTSSLCMKNRMVTSMQSTAKGLKLGANRGTAEMKAIGLERWFYRRSSPRENSCLPYEETQHNYALKLMVLHNLNLPIPSLCSFSSMVCHVLQGGGFPEELRSSWGVKSHLLPFLPLLNLAIWQWREVK